MYNCPMADTLVKLHNLLFIMKGMMPVTYLMITLELLLVISFIGYLFSIIKEKTDISNYKVSIKSKKVTQKIIDDIDYKMFKLGDTKLNIGDEIKVYLRNNKLIKGTLIGAKKKNNSLCVVTEKDELVELHITTIKKLKVVSRYGKIF